MSITIQILSSVKTAKVSLSYFICHEELNQETGIDHLSKYPGHFQVGLEPNMVR